VSVAIRLEDNIGPSRGDMLARTHNRPMVGQDLDAILAWISCAVNLRPGADYAIKHTTRWA